MTGRPFVQKIDPKLAPRLIKDLEEKGFEITKPDHTLFAAKKKGVSCTLYTSGKLVVQGKEKEELIEFYLEPDILGSFDYSHPDLTPRIGSDEAGKGDFFGPLCIASLFADEERIKKLKAAGVADSKGFRDEKILKLAKEIEKTCPHQIVVINPQKYNELYSKFRNLNNMLAWAHATAIDTLVEETGCKRVTVDQFAYGHVLERAVKQKKNAIELTQRHRGEEDIVVAAASILARRAFLNGLDSLRKKYGVEFPKGASEGVVAKGKEFVRKYGDRLNEVGKLHFKTTERVLGG